MILKISYVLGAVFAAAGYIYALVSIHRNQPTNALVWLTWGLMDLAVLIPAFRNNDDVFILGIYTVGSLSVAGYAAYKRMWQLAREQELLLVLAVGCMAASQLISPPKTAIILGTCCLMITGLTLLIHIWKSNSQSFTEFLVTLCFLIAAAFGVVIAYKTDSRVAVPWTVVIYSVIWVGLTWYKYKYPKVA